MTERRDSMPLEIARELAQQGESRMSALMNLATAADLRATTLCGILGASAVGVGAAVLTAVVANAGHTLDRLIFGGSIVAACFFLAAVISAIAGAPRDFFIQGGDPDQLRNWLWADGQWRSESEMIEATAMRYAASINNNDRILRWGSRRVNAALLLAFAGPILGLVGFFYFH